MGSDTLQNRACCSQAQRFDVDKNQNSPLFGVIIEGEKMTVKVQKARVKYMLLGVPTKYKALLRSILCTSYSEILWFIKESFNG